MSPSPRRAVCLWSGGKDSCLALEAALSDSSLQVEALATTVTDEYERISMHGVRRELLERQAAAVALPLHVARIPRECTNAEYEAAVARTMVPLRDAGITHVVCGDLYLADIRSYRERQFAAIGLEAVFPLWRRDTGVLARDFIRRGYVATLCCVDPRQIDRDLAGRSYDLSLLDDLPTTADPCGENGEFHTFVSDGPLFGSPVPFDVGPAVERDGFCFRDITLAQRNSL